MYTYKRLVYFMNKQKKERTEQKIQYGKYSRMPLA